MIDVAYEYIYKQEFNLNQFYNENKQTLRSSPLGSKDLAVLKDVCTIKMIEKEENQEEMDNMCSICYSDFRKNENVIKMPQCEHLYHYHCIEPWLKQKNSCAMCKADVRYNLLLTIHNHVRRGIKTGDAQTRGENNETTEAVTTNLIGNNLDDDQVSLTGNDPIED